MNYFDSLQGFMDYSVARREAMSNNISNLDTPGFKAKNVNLTSRGFENKLALSRTNSDHFNPTSDGMNYTVTENTNTSVRTDGNNVDLNKEMVEMVKNNFEFNLSVEAMNKYFSIRSLAKGK